jgi:prepilin-type processing-associated H-X9-DG protein
MLVRVGNWNSSDPDAWTAAGGWASWTLMVDPYQKSVDINGSPLAGPIYLSGEIPRRTGNRFMEYGYNYGYLSPSYYSGGWPTPITSIASTSAAQPADTIMITDRAARQSYGSEIYWYGAGTGWMIMGTSETPACYTDPNIWCTDGWGTGSWYQTYISDAIDGNLTGDVAPRANGMVGTAFLDGHVKKMSLGALTVGTNWNPTIADSSVQITDATKYLWNTSKS